MGVAVARGPNQEQDDEIEIKTLGMPKSMWKEIDEFRARERIAARQEAVRRLILIGLRAAGISDGDSQGEPD
jgi:hypothetical protein